MIPRLSELDDVLLYLETTALEPHDEYKSEFTYKEQKLLFEYIKSLTKYKDAWQEIMDLYNDWDFDFSWAVTHSLLENTEIKYNIREI